MSTPTLPTELVHDILATTIADLIHAVALSQNDNLQWELNAFTTLSLISREFKDIVSEILVKTLVGNLVERVLGISHANIIRLAQDRLNRFYTNLVLEIRKPKPDIIFDDIPLDGYLQIYAFLLSGRRIFEDYVRCSSEVFVMMNETVVQQQSATLLHLCSYALCPEPAIKRDLFESVRGLVHVSRSGCSIVKSCKELYDHADTFCAIQERLEESDSDPAVAEELAALTARIRKTVDDIALEDVVYREALEASRIDLATSAKCPTHKLPGVLSTFHKLNLLDFGDTYNFTDQFVDFIDRWKIEPDQPLPEPVSFLEVQDAWRLYRDLMEAVRKVVDSMHSRLIEPEIARLESL
ncbi:hypothetical protein C8J56DRAFT_144019 [Mycena floridula]|nr:hypothetical protein C8J56DRAFT_144019 [Mycena floridula]